MCVCVYIPGVSEKKYRSMIDYGIKTKTVITLKFVVSRASGKG